MPLTDRHGNPVSTGSRAALDRLFVGRAPGRDSLSSGDAPPKGRRS